VTPLFSGCLGKYCVVTTPAVESSTIFSICRIFSLCKSSILISQLVPSGQKDSISQMKVVLIEPFVISSMIVLLSSVLPQTIIILYNLNQSPHRGCYLHFQPLSFFAQMFFGLLFFFILIDRYKYILIYLESLLIDFLAKISKLV
jgi:hypothetical protein